MKAITKTQAEQFFAKAQEAALLENGDLNDREGYLEELYDALSEGNFTAVAAISALLANN